MWPALLVSDVRGGLTSLKTDNLVEISTNSSLKIQLNQKSLGNFYLHVRKDYPELSSKVLKVLIPFPPLFILRIRYETE